MTLAAATCDCGVPMIGTGWLLVLAVIVVVAPAVTIATLRHLRLRKSPPDDRATSLP